MVLVAPQTGIYPIRILYWQTTLGANLQFYTISPDGTTRVLVNDPNDSTALIAYRDSNRTAANGPYAAEVSPFPGSSGVASTIPITALLNDGLQTTVTLSSVSMSLNAVTASITKSKTGARTSVSYSPPPLRADPNNAVKLTYLDSGSVSHTNQWSFQIKLRASKGPQQTLTQCHKPANDI